MVVSWWPRRGAFRREWSAVSDAAMRPSEFKQRKACSELGNDEQVGAMPGQWAAL